MSIANKDAPKIRTAAKQKTATGSDLTEREEGLTLRTRGQPVEAIFQAERERRVQVD